VNTVLCAGRLARCGALPSRPIYDEVRLGHKQLEQRDLARTVGDEFRMQADCGMDVSLAGGPFPVLAPRLRRRVTASVTMRAVSHAAIVAVGSGKRSTWQWKSNPRDALSAHARTTTGAVTRSTSSMPRRNTSAY